MARPMMLWLLLAVPALVLLMWRGVRLRRLALRHFGVDQNVRPRVPARAAALITLVCLALALAQPSTKTLGTREGSTETVFLLDVSRSMLADDAKPSRLERAKQVINDYVMQRQGDRFALIAFAGTQSVECTLTTDTAFFLEMLKRTGRGSVSRGGTRIGDAIRFATRVGFDELEEQDQKQLVILTDGGDQDSSPERAWSESEGRGIHLIVAGIGTELYQSIVPVSLTDRTPVRSGGEIVRTRLESLGLRNLALAAGNKGEYRNLSEVPLVTPVDGSATRARDEHSRLIGMVLAAVAFALLFAESLSSKFVRSRTIAVGVMMALLLDIPIRLRAEDSVEDWAFRGYNSFQEMKFGSAISHYIIAVKQSNGRLDLVYNLACAYYKDGQYDEALVEFAKVQSKAAKGSDLELKSRKSRADALYWKSGDADLGAAEFMLMTALSEYREIVKLRPEMKDAAYNAEVVERQLRKLHEMSPRGDAAAHEEDERDSGAAIRGGKATGGRSRAGRRQVVEQDW